MARKKMTRTAKGSKMSAKKKTTKAVLPLTVTMEKDFRSAPAKIAAEYRNEVAILKQQDGKLKAELKKAQLVQKALAALTGKNTAAAKKQLATVKKTQVALIKAVKESTKQLEQIKKLGKAKTEKHQLFTAIGRQLSKLEKELSQKKPAATAKAKPAKKTRKTSAKAKPATFSKHETQPEAQSVTHTESRVEETESTS